MTPAVKLWRWFQKNARDLPWRKAAANGLRDPYRVWLAEIMLQQTQVKTVIPYYENFLSHYPTLNALAAAPVERVLADWAGLGYYSRARNLHACAKFVADELNGQWPNNAHDLHRLPGVGTYTAAAIAALAFGEKCVAIDGNVARVLSRVGAIAKPAAKAQAELAKVGEALLYASSRGGSAEALIELGAVICTPKNPRCQICPLQNHCAAFQLNRVEDFPVKEKKTKPVPREAAVLVLTNPGAKILVIKRGARGLFGGMVALPSSALQPGESEHALFTAHARRAKPVGNFHHTLSHIQFHVTVLHRHLGHRAAAAASGFGTWQAPDVAKTSMPQLFQKSLATGTHK